MYWTCVAVLCVTSVLFIRLNNAQLPALLHERNKDGKLANFLTSQGKQMTRHKNIGGELLPGEGNMNLLN